MASSIWTTMCRDSGLTIDEAKLQNFELSNKE